MPSVPVSDGGRARSLPYLGLCTFGVLLCRLNPKETICTLSTRETKLLPPPIWVARKRLWLEAFPQQHLWNSCLHAV